MSFGPNHEFGKAGLWEGPSRVKKTIGELFWEWEKIR